MPIKKTTIVSAPSTSPLIIAHRGFSDEAPENSVAAFHRAIVARCDMIELDVRLSADNIPMVFHDRRLNRTSSANGPINKRTAEQLSAIDNGSWFSPKFSNERIATLAEVFQQTKKAVPFNIEIKPDVQSTAKHSVVELVLNEMRKAKMLSKALITSFNHKMVKEVKEIDNSVVTGVLYNPITHFRKSPSMLIRNARAEIFVCSKIQINNDVVNDIHDSGYKLYVYGVKTGRDVQQMLDWEIDGIICNNPRFVRETIELLSR
jgi:glycerophosphoryl diester phosphodiesterase